MLDPVLFIELIEHTEDFREPNELEQPPWDNEPPTLALGESGYRVIVALASCINSSLAAGKTCGSLVTNAMDCIAS